MQSRAIAIAVAAMFGWQFYLAILHFREPFYYDGVSPELSQIKQGDALIVRYDFTKARLCRSELNRFILDESTDTVIAREVVPGGATLSGRHTVANAITATRTLPPGHYILRTMVYSECSDGPHAAVSPDVRFTVVP